MKIEWLDDFGSSAFFARLTLACCFAFSLLFLFLRFQGLPRSPLANESLPFLAAAIFIAGAIVAQRPVHGRSLTRRLFFLAFTLLIILSAPFAFMQNAFGFKAIEPILFYLPELSGGDTTTLAMEFHLRAVINTASATLIAIVAAWFLAMRVRHFATGLLLAAFAMGVYNPITVYAISGKTDDGYHALIRPQADVLPARVAAAPTRKRNLVLFYMEGFERTLAELPFSRDAYERVASIAQTGIEFTGIRELHGLNYSAAGLVATQCGVPLLPRGFTQRLWWETPQYIRDDGFMPEVECLSDRLAEDGYRTVFVNGSDLSMFGIRNFLQTHNYRDVIELDHFRGRGLDKHMSGWGYDDHALMQVIEEELTGLAAAEQPFLLSFLTIGTHGPDGVLDVSCDTPAAGAPHLPIAVDCAVGHLESFLDMLARLGLADETVVAVMSDHLMMENSFQMQFDAVEGPRENMFFLLNAGAPRRVERQGSMLDVYPTLLEALGYDLVGGRAGLGRSFLSDGLTLVEQHSEEGASRAIRRNYALAEWLWRAPGE